jgi:GntR family transcriptional regulator
VPGPGVGDRARLKHESVRGHLLAAMRDELGPGGKLPSERELAERLGVSRPTVRRALDQLAVEGRIQRVQGSGTFAAPAPPPAEGPGALRLVAAEAVVAGAERSARLGVSPGEPVWRVERLRVVDGVPVCLEVTYVVQACAPRLLDHPLDGPLRERYDVAIVHVRQRVTATVLEPSAAEALDVPALSPALAIERLASDAGGRRVELAKCLCRGDRFALELSGTPRLRATVQIGG